MILLAKWLGASTPTCEWDSKDRSASGDASLLEFSNNITDLVGEPSQCNPARSAPGSETDYRNPGNCPVQ